MDNCTEEDCTEVVANSTQLTKEEKRLWLGVIRGLQRLHHAGLERDKVLGEHVGKEEEYWKRMEPVILSAEQWQQRRKWLWRGTLAFAAIVAWMLDAWHHALDVASKWHHKP